VFLSGLMADSIGLGRSMTILALMPLLAGFLALTFKDRHPRGLAAERS
jgi:hypothetical protein